MLLRNALVLLILVFISSCKTHNESNPFPVALKDEWTSIDDLIGIWTELQRDNKGYLHYIPCDGETPGIEITKDSVLLIPQLENPIAFRIDQFSIERDSLSITASSKELNAVLTFKVVDPKEQQLLLKWYFPKSQNRGKQILTRNQLLVNYRSVDNTCVTEKRPELQFLPIVID